MKGLDNLLNPVEINQKAKYQIVNYSLFNQFPPGSS
jgi:hypothetical protein